MDLGIMDNQAGSLGLREVGSDVTIWPMARIVTPEAISIGDAVIIDDFVFIMGGASTTIGSFVHIGAFTSIVGGGEFVISDFAGLSAGVRVFTGNEDYSGGSMTNPTVPAPYRSPVRSFVRIGKHAIVGANAVILPGVVVGEGAVVGANALVVKDCKPWTTYFGSPARAIAARPSETILSMEADLRRDVYDAAGRYISKKDRVRNDRA
jgi:galactoside O-acetyltransferase